jgi:predicted double-glycine peptidase
MKNIKLQIQLISLPDDQSCALSCVAMILAYQKSSIEVKSIINKIKVDEWGFSLLDIAEVLVKLNLNIEFGFFDEDIIGKRNYEAQKVVDIALLSDLKKNIKHKIFKDQIDQTINFSKNALVKIEKPSVEKIENSLASGRPVLIHLEVATYYNKNDDSIHSVLVIGADSTSFIILDPILGEQTVKKQKLLKSWLRAGGYYLIIN